MCFVGPRAVELPSRRTCQWTVNSPTSRVWLLGRTAVHGEADLAAARALQATYALRPIESYLQGGPPNGATFDNGDAAVGLSPKAILETMGAEEFFDCADELIRSIAPLQPADSPMRSRLDRLYSRSRSSVATEAMWASLTKYLGVKCGRPYLQLQTVVTALPLWRLVRDGWKAVAGVGSYGTEYNKRAVVAKVGLGANLEVDAVYRVSLRVFDPSTPRFIRFPVPPPVEGSGFWSVTLYNEEDFLLAGPDGRRPVHLSSYHNVARDAGGGIVLRLQLHDPADACANWLPTPAGARYRLVVRFYWPDQAIQNLSWIMPPIESGVPIQGPCE